MAATSSNRRQIAAVLETTLGVTPGSPRMRQKLAVNENIKYGPTFVDSSEMRSDRMTADSIVVGLDSSGTIGWEFHYPYPESVEDMDIRSAFYNTWVTTPFRDNDVTASSVGAASVGAIAVTATGTTFQIGHLVRTTGFAVAGNNVNAARITTAGTTTVTSTGNFAVEATPPTTARIKVVGMQGASGDFTITNGNTLNTTALNFVQLGLVVGQWIKIGGTATSDRFATAACNGRARIASMTTTTLVLDNLPTGFANDTGTGKTIKVWFGDRIINGTTTVSQTIERGDLGMVTPVYLVSPGMIASQWQLSVKPKAIVTGTTTYMGMSGSVSTTTLDAVIDQAPPASSYPQYAGSANVGRVSEFGNPMVTPNWCIGFDLTLANNLSPVESVDAVGPQDLVPGEALVTGTLNTIFGDQTVVARYQAGIPTSLNIAMSKLTNMVLITIPRAVLNSDGNPNAGGKNQLINASFGFRGSIDPVTSSVISMDRLEYFEA